MGYISKDDLSSFEKALEDSPAVIEDYTLNLKQIPELIRQTASKELAKYQEGPYITLLAVRAIATEDKKRNYVFDILRDEYYIDIDKIRKEDNEFPLINKGLFSDCNHCVRCIIGMTVTDKLGVGKGKMDFSNHIARSFEIQKVIVALYKYIMCRQSLWEDILYSEKKKDMSNDTSSNESS
jgi:hypothetical protein